MPAIMNIVFTAMDTLAMVNSSTLAWSFDSYLTLQTLMNVLRILMDVHRSVQTMSARSHVVVALVIV